MTTDPFDRIPAASSSGPAAKVRSDVDPLVWVPSINFDKAPPLRAAWGSLGAPVQVWQYFAANGSILRAVARFTKADGSKDIRPVTLWKYPNGKLGWKLKAEPDGVKRPLYGLDRLARRPDAPVLIVEGEKAADSAAERFPDFVAMTWPGGAKAVAKADWSTLAGRRTVVWPDADEAGATAAGDVRRALRGVAAACAVVELPPLMPDKWDLADEWPSVLDLRAAERLVRDAQDRAQADSDPAAPFPVKIPAGFELDERGWSFTPERDNDDGKSTRICGRFEVLARSRNGKSEDWGLHLAVKDPDGVEHKVTLSKSSLEGDGIEVRKKLASVGLWISPNKNAREYLQILLKGIDTEARALVVEAIGWHGNVFVLPDQSIGDTGGHLYIWKGKGGTFHGTAGTWEAWRDEVAKPLEHNPLAAFCMCLAFSAPLLERTEDESSGVHLVGDSRSGKSTLLVLAGSTFGGGGKRGASQSWNSTPAALEGLAAGHNGTLMPMDELGELDPTRAGTVFYGLAGGVTKSRFNENSEFRDRPSWTLQILSCGEETLAELMKSARQKVKVGQEMRLLQLSADAGDGMGCWSVLPDGFDDPASFSESIKITAKQHYGHALPRFLAAYLRDEPKWLAIFKQLRAAWIAQVVKPGDHGQTRNAISRFAHVAAAGELACLLGVLPWQKGTAGRAAVVQFESWLREFGREMVREERNAIDHLKAWLEENEGSAFAHLKNPSASDGDEINEYVPPDEPDGPRADEARGLKTAGFSGRVDGHCRVFFIGTGRWKEIMAGFDPVKTARKLKEMGHLLTDGDPKRCTKKQRVRGEKSPRTFYAVKETLLQMD